MTKLIVMVTNRNGNEFGIEVFLPLDQASYRVIESQLDGLTLVLSPEDKARFRSKIEYLPATMEELGNAERIYRETGTDWHTACESARKALKTQ